MNSFILISVLKIHVKALCLCMRERNEKFALANIVFCAKCFMTASLSDCAWSSTEDCFNTGEQRSNYTFLPTFSPSLSLVDLCFNSPLRITICSQLGEQSKQIAQNTLLLVRANFSSLFALDLSYKRKELERH